MICPECGARNSPRASWCTQCLTPLGEPEPAAADEPTEAPSPPVDASGRGLRTIDGEVEWRCEECDTWNPLFVASCSVCGAAIGGTGASDTLSGPGVARARTLLWVAAAVICVLAVVGVVVSLVAAQGFG